MRAATSLTLGEQITDYLYSIRGEVPRRGKASSAKEATWVLVAPKIGLGTAIYRPADPIGCSRLRVRQAGVLTGR